MLATLIIVFREVIEAGLIIGIVLAATRGVPRRELWVAGGILAGALGACLVAVFASAIAAALAGTGQEIFNVAILLLAVLMLAWHNAWMAHHGREMVQEMKTVSKEVVMGRRSLIALSVVVGVAVLREGSEVVLFIYGIAVSGSDTLATMLAGGLGGLLLGVAVAALMYFGLLRVPERHLFRVTGWLITLLAAGMASQAIAFLQQAQLVTALTQPAWNSSALISDGSITGKFLHALIGYTARPTVLQVLVYLLTITGIVTLARLVGATKGKHKAPSIKKMGETF